ncbi:MAG TPA: winged helix-turn-helix domain-containing protein, partial [Phycisphaerales bacterium]|nr:winged helix-turn-helix domain-containing protein [Phycisphaerales bacterium]
SNVIDVVIAALRRKTDHGFSPQLIHTVIGAGYRFGVMEETGQELNSHPTSNSPNESPQTDEHTSNTSLMQ